LIGVFALMTITSCTKEEVPTNVIPETTTGNLTFWVDSNFGVGDITVTCNGITKIISNYYGSHIPDCGENGCANFNLNEGTYTYTASAESSTWNGTVIVTKGGCTKQQLQASGTGGGTGNAMFWIASDLGQGNISVTCNGSTQLISSSYTGVPSCGASGIANFNLNAGTYNYSAVAGSLSWNGSITVTSGGCTKQQLDGSGGGTGGGNGNVSFYSKLPTGDGAVTVYIEGQALVIPSFTISGSDGCGASTDANFTLPAGTYHFTASSYTGVHTWSGDVTVVTGGCAKQRIDTDNTDNGGGAGGGNGNVSFWVKTDLGCGNITVNVNGQSGSITGYNTNGVSDCSVSGGANFTLPAGNYNYTASCSGGVSWSGTITVTAGGCLLQQLTGSTTASGCNYSLDGTWTRQNDGGCPNSTGMKIYFSNGQGVIQSAASNTCGFYTGQVKWKNFNSSSCTIDDLIMPTDNYSSYSISFVNSSSFKIGSVTYTR